MLILTGRLFCRFRFDLRSLCRDLIKQGVDLRVLFLFDLLIGFIRRLIGENRRSLRLLFAVLFLPSRLTGIGFGKQALRFLGIDIELIIRAETLCPCKAESAPLLQRSPRQPARS